MANFEARTNGNGPYYVGEDVTHVNGAGIQTITVSEYWRRDAWGYTSSNPNAGYSINIGGTVKSGKFNFYGGAGGAIGKQAITSLSRAFSRPEGSPAYNVAVTVTIDTGTQDGGSGSVSGVYTLPRVPYSAPGTPAAPTVVSNNPGEFTASWVKPSGTVSDYRLAYRVNGGSWVYLTTTATSLTQGGLLPGGSVEVIVQARNADANSAYSAGTTITMEASPPGAPPAPTVTAGVAQVTVSWPPVSDSGGKPVTSYDLQYRVNNGAWTLLSNVTSPKIISGLESGTVDVQLRANNVDANGAWSPTGSATIVSGAISVFVNGGWVKRSVKARLGADNKPKPLKVYKLGAWVNLNG